MKIQKIGGKDYVIHYSINSLIEMEKATGKSFTQLFNSEGFSLSTIRDLVFYGLKAKAKITEEGAGEILDALIEEGMPIEQVATLFVNELMAALGIKQEEVVEASPNE